MGRIAQLVSARPSVGVVPSWIPHNIASLFQLRSFLFRFNDLALNTVDLKFISYYYCHELST